MRSRLTIAGGFAVAVAVVSVGPARLVGQAPAVTPRASATAKPSIPRMPDGRPDLQGMYDLATLTPVERPAGQAATLTPEEARTLEALAASRRETADGPVTAERTAPPVGGDGSTGAAGGVGGYNNFWLDPGSSYTVVNGQKRSSIVVDPPNGRVPAITPEARARLLAGRTVRTSDQTQRESDPGLEPPGSYDNPEQRPLGERCLLSFGSSSGPPALPTYFYNNLHQIVQTRDTVMILTEMVHDARIVRLNAEHLPSSIRKWNGDSVGRWEGDTLVVDTTNFTDKTRFRGASENLRVVERFSRIDEKTLLYRFTVEDPATWATPWTGEYAWPATTDQMYEYACHENNYALEGILRGARFREAEALKKK
jgi:hypothetical protein